MSDPQDRLSFLLPGMSRIGEIEAQSGFVTPQRNARWKTAEIGNTATWRDGNVGANAFTPSFSITAFLDRPGGLHFSDLFVMYIPPGRHYWDWLTTNK